MDILDQISTDLDANEIVPYKPDRIDIRVEAMLNRMLDGPDDGRSERLERIFKFNATSDRLHEVDVQAVADRQAWEEGYTDLEPLGEFFVRAGAVTALAGLALTTAIYVGIHRFKRTK